MDRDSRPTDRMAYLDFDLEIGRGRARRYPVTARSTVTGEAHAEMRFPYTEQVLENRLLALELAVLQLSGTRRRIASPKEQTAQDFGKALFDALFTGDLRSLYGESLRAAEQQGKGLDTATHRAAGVGGAAMGVPVRHAPRGVHVPLLPNADRAIPGSAPAH